MKLWGLECLRIGSSITLILGACIFLATSLGAQVVLLSRYNFEGDLSDLLGNSGSLISINTSAESFGPDGWTWNAISNPGGGLIMDVDGALADNYSIGLRFEFDNATSGWRKIIDFKDHAIDTGLYFLNGNIQFFPVTPGSTALSNDTFLDLIITRDQSNGLVSVYLNGSTSPETSFNDSGLNAVALLTGSSKARFIFFQDDTATNGEWTPGGTVRRILVWNAPLIGPSELTTGFNALATAVVPEPSSFAMVIGLFAIGAVLFGRRRHYKKL